MIFLTSFWSIFLSVGMWMLLGIWMLCSFGAIGMGLEDDSAHSEQLILIGIASSILSICMTITCVIYFNQGR